MTYVDEIEKIPVTTIALSMIYHIEHGTEEVASDRYMRIFQGVLDDGGFTIASIMAATTAVTRDLLHTMTPEQQREWWQRVLPNGPI